MIDRTLDTNAENRVLLHLSAMAVDSGLVVVVVGDVYGSLKFR